jgi:hypothetical protein
MERTIEFHNIQYLNKQIAADFYLEGEFVVKLVGNIEHLIKSNDTRLGFYEYFRQAMLSYINHTDFYVGSGNNTH